MVKDTKPRGRVQCESVGHRLGGSRRGRATMAKAERIQASQVFDTEEVASARYVVRVAVGPHADLVVLSLDAPPDYRRTAPSGANFAKLRADHMNCYWIDHFRSGEWSSLALTPTNENFHFVQPLGEWGWLLVRGRADGNSDKNAHVYGMGGTCLRSFHAGDGIEEIQATEEGRIWVSYFDEGVFGETALGQTGLACLDSSGRVSFRFSELASAGAVPDIADCYALNVCSNRETWLYYYTDFPLVRLVDGQVAGLWTGIGVKGLHAFAVSGEHALLAGGYSKRNRLFLVDLATSKVKERIPVDEKGRAIEGFAAFGRESHLWLQSGSALFVVDLSDEDN